jgi:hypothetical protein
MPLSPVKWAPDGAWIAYDGRGGLSIASPDGKSTRTLSEQPWIAFDWSENSERLLGIRQSDDFKHLTVSSVELRSGAERVVAADLMTMPVASQPVRGFTRMSATTYLTSIVHVSSDIWLVEGFGLTASRPSFWPTLGRRSR